MKILITLLVCLLATGSTIASDIDTQIELVRHLAETERQAMVTLNMNLTDEENEGFWPVWHEYRTARTANGDRLLALIKNYAEHHMDLSDAKANELLEESFQVDTELLEIKREFAGRFAEVLPPTKVMRLMQIESKMDMVARLNVAVEIPLAE
jgi:hypothetical protein